MKHRILRHAAVGIGALGLLIPSPALLADESAKRMPAIPGFEAPLVSDVELGPGGTLMGQVLDVEGQGAAGIPVTVRRNDATLAATTSGAEGKFAVAGL